MDSMEEYMTTKTAGFIGLAALLLAYVTYAYQEDIAFSLGTVGATIFMATLFLGAVGAIFSGWYVYETMVKDDAVIIEPIRYASLPASVPEPFAQAQPNAAFESAYS
ncbi:MAG: hypothetical protein N2B06_04810 [Clostridium sp.]